MSGLLVGDIGGTHARLAIADGGELSHLWTRPCADFPDPYAMIEAYLAETGVQPDRAVLGVTGPIANGEANQANNGWRFSEARLSAMGLSPARLVNDFEALAMACPHLPPESRAVIGPPPEGEPMGRLAIIGPGTGLGVAGLVRRKDGDVAVAGEGGHIGFAPFDETEAQIAAVLARDCERLDLEVILSGPGLARLYVAVAEVEGRFVEPLRPQDVVAGALAGDAQCRDVVQRFWAILASAAGDFALVYGASGGVFIGGGVAHRIAPLLDPLAFRARFEAKGSRTAMMRGIPAHLITDPFAALKGAVLLASRD